MEAIGEPAKLDGKRIIVVEDDAMLARELSEQLRAMGATVLGPAPTSFYALQLIGPGRRKLDAAILDIHLHGTTVYEFADVLRERSVPFLFATGYDCKTIPTRYKQAPVLQKPIAPLALVEELTRMMRPPISEHVERPAPPAAVRNEEIGTVFARILAGTLGSR